MAEVVTMPKLGFDMAEGTLIRWVKAEGDQVEKGELLAEIETDKATVEVESMYSGVVHKHLVDQNAVVPVNTPIAVIGEKDEKIDLDALLGEAGAEEAEPQTEEAAEAEQAAPEAEAMPVAETVSTPTSGDGHLPGGVRATPVARRMAEERGLDIRQISGSGPGGRVLKKDVEAHLAAPRPKAPASEKDQLPIQELPPLPSAELGLPPPDVQVPLSKLRAAIGRRMAQAKQQAPHFYVTYEYDAASLMEVRRQANALLGAGGEKLSVNDFIIKATALTLRQYPNLNASLADDHVVQHGRVNIGVAVAVENGLLTVVCQGADRKPLRQIAREVRQMAQRARQGRVRPEDIEGSTFSVSNLGMFDVDDFIAIINPPEAAILAVGAVRQVPVVEEGQIGIGQRMKATISVDHRVSDGAEAARFMQTLALYLENPAGLLL